MSSLHTNRSGDQTMLPHRGATVIHHIINTPEFEFLVMIILVFPKAGDILHNCIDGLIDRGHYSLPFSAVKRTVPAVSFSVVYSATSSG